MKREPSSAQASLRYGLFSFQLLSDGQVHIESDINWEGDQFRTVPLPIDCYGTTHLEFAATLSAAVGQFNRERQMKISEDLRTTTGTIRIDFKGNRDLGRYTAL